MELLVGLAASAAEVSAKYEDSGFRSFLAVEGSVELVEGSLLEEDWSDGDVVFANSTSASGSEKKSPPSKIQTTTCKRADCGLAVPPYHRAKPIYLPSNATDTSRGRPPAFFETLARPSTLRASRLRIPRRVQVPRK